MIINKHITSYLSHTKIFQHLDYSLFVGLDDTTIIYPLLYAASDNSICSLGIQHGAYVKRHEDYIMNGITNYKWFDKIVVWGEYWKRLLQKYSDSFDDDYYLIGSNKLSYNYQQPKKLDDKRIVLIPYEFLTDTIAVGKYMRKFIDQGFDVHFKVRPIAPGESKEEQLNAYFLGDYSEKITFVEQITTEQMSSVSIVAGTQTTLLFDLLPFRKTTFILDTNYSFLLDMVDNGFATLVSMNDMDSINDVYYKESLKSYNIDDSDIFGSEPIGKVISKYMHSIKRLK